MEIGSTIANQSVRSGSSRNLLSLAKQRCNVSSILCFCYLLSYPEPCFIIHQCIQILGIAFYLQIQLIGSPCLPYVRFKLFQICVHKRNIFPKSFVYGNMTNLFSLYLQKLFYVSEWFAFKIKLDCCWYYCLRWSVHFIKSNIEIENVSHILYTNFSVYHYTC